MEKYRHPTTVFTLVLFFSLKAAGQLPLTSETVHTKNMELLWKFKTGSRIFSSATSGNGLIYFGSDDDRIYALDEKSGKQAWSYLTGGPVNSSPALAHGKLFVLSNDGFFYALDAKKGKMIWRFKTGGEKKKDMWDYYLSDPVIINNNVYFGSSDSCIYSLQSSTGKLIWKYKTGGQVHAKPAFTNDTLFAGSFDGYLYSLNAGTGKLLWKFRSVGDAYFPNGEFQKGALYYQKILWAGSRDYNIYAINPKTGRGLWNMKEGGSWVIATPFAYDKYIYFGTSDSHAFYCINVTTGGIKWKLRLNMRVYGSAVFYDGQIYFGCFNGKLYGADALTGEINQAFQSEGSRQNYLTVYDSTGEFRKDFSVYGTTEEESKSAENKIMSLGSMGATPLLQNGILYIGSTDGYFYAVAPGK